jgi:hypothetical protein
MVQCRSVKCTYNILSAKENIVPQGTVQLTSTLAAAGIRYIKAHILMLKCKLMFISIPTNVHRSNIKLILKLLRHVSVFLHHPQGAYKFCQLQL